MCTSTCTIKLFACKTSHFCRVKTNGNTGCVGCLYLFMCSAYLQCYITNSMKRCHCLEVDSRSAGLLWKAEVHYDVHKSPELDTILYQVTPVQVLMIYLRFTLILSSHLRLGLPNGLLRLDLPTKIFIHFSYPHARCMPRPSHPH
jgi:hypothetical protein